MPMKRTRDPQPADPAETEQPNLPAESARLLSDDAQDRNPIESAAAKEIPEPVEESYYLYHWGINE